MQFALTVSTIKDRVVMMAAVAAVYPSLRAARLALLVPLHGHATVERWIAARRGLAHVHVPRGWEALKKIGWSIQAPRPMCTMRYVCGCSCIVTLSEVA